MEKSSVKPCSDSLLCGIDGGGTTTKVVVCNLEGQVVHSFQTGTINHYGAGAQKARENFEAIADKLNAELDCLPGTIFVGNSALDGLAENSLVQEITGNAFKTSNVFFHSDVYIALLSFTMGKPGAVLISGTGSMACGIDAGGDFHTAGGWGQVLGDEGSGYHMALKGIKAALRAYDGLGKTTLLREKVMKYFHLKEMPDLIDKIYDPPVEKSVIAAFATEVDIAANEGDIIALEIIEGEAKWLFKLAMAITRKCRTPSLGYVGSVISKNERIRSTLTALLAEQQIDLQVPRFKPEIGALIGAFQESGNHVTDAVINNFATYSSK
jgi:N-acetylglucosamine kinase-like BadF-type ATPase